MPPWGDTLSKGSRLITLVSGRRKQPRVLVFSMPPFWFRKEKATQSKSALTGAFFYPSYHL